MHMLTACSYMLRVGSKSVLLGMLSKSRLEPLRNQDQFAGVTNRKGENIESVKGEERTSFIQGTPEGS